MVDAVVSVVVIIVDVIVVAVTAVVAVVVSPLHVVVISVVTSISEYGNCFQVKKTVGYSPNTLNTSFVRMHGH